MSAGTYFGKYFLLKRLAQGGMGEIYIARQQGPGGFSKTVALKKVLPHLTDNKEFIQGFLGEAALAAKMQHRNIVSVFDFGLDEESNSYFLTMEYVAGKALNQLLEACNAKKERLPLSLIKDIAVQMCDGISYAHNLCDDLGQPLNLVHRDLNPSNLLLSYSGDVKIIDWGIAKSEMSQVKTEAGMIKGKFVYMSPEQSMAKKLDMRSDIFAAGITLYEMLTGENPFHKPNVVLSLEAIQRLDPPPPSEFDPALAGFDPIVAKALAKDREKRYQDCAEMAEDLKTVVVPPSTERLGALLGRMFRADLEQEQKLMQDTAAAKLPPRGSSSSARLPQQAPAHHHQAAPKGSDDEQGGTLVIGPDSGVSQEELRRQMDTARRKLLAQQQAQQQQAAQRAAQMQQPPEAARTMFIGAADIQPPPPKSSNKGLLLGIGAGVVVGLIGVGAFFFLQQNDKAIAVPPRADPAPAPAVQVVVPTGKAEEPQKAEPAQAAEPVRVEPAKATEQARPEPAKAVETPKSEPVKIASATPPPAAPAPAPKAEPAKPVEAPTPVEVAKPVEAPKPAPITAPAPVEKPKEAKAGGSLLLKTIPAMAMKHNGKELNTASKIAVAGSGTFDLGDDTVPFRVKVEYTAGADGKMVARVNAEPWAILSVGGLSKGRTPQALDVDDSLQRVELKRPGVEQTVMVLLKYTKE